MYSFKKNERKAGAKAILGLLILTFLLFANACENEIPANLPLNPLPIDTLAYLPDPGDTCSQDTVYFEQEILPILVSNCAITGCHDAQSANKQIIIESYESMMRNEQLIQRSRSPKQTSLFLVINSDDIEKVMPPLPNEKLNQQQIELIDKWLGQGFPNNSCVQVCDTSNITFSGTISPIIDVFCTGCHRGPNPSGGIDYSDFQGIQESAKEGSLYGSITQTGLYTAMPPSQKLSSCKVELIQLWIDAGALNN